MDVDPGGGWFARPKSVRATGFPVARPGSQRPGDRADRPPSSNDRDVREEKKQPGEMIPIAINKLAALAVDKSKSVHRVAFLMSNKHAR